MKFAKVSPDGTVSGLEDASKVKYSFGSMLSLRVSIVFLFIQISLSTLTDVHTLLKQQKKLLLQP
jgi:hypothetical protein